MLNIGICDDDSDVCVALASWLNEYAQEVSPEIRYHENRLVEERRFRRS